MSISVYTSAEPLISLLRDDDLDIRSYALDEIELHLHEFWSQLASHVDYVEQLAKNADVTTPEGVTFQQKAYSIASKLHHHLGDMDNALRCALTSKLLFTRLEQQEKNTSLVSVTENTSTAAAPAPLASKEISIIETFGQTINTAYEQSIIAECITSYIAYRHQLILHNDGVAQFDSLYHGDNLVVELPSLDALPREEQYIQAGVPSLPAPIDEQIEPILVLLLSTSIKRGHYYQALGLALDTLRLDWIQQVLLAAPVKDVAGLLRDVYQYSTSIVDIAVFRNDLLRLLVRLYQTAPPNGANNQTATTTAAVETEFDQTAIILDPSVAQPLRPSTSTPLHVISDFIALSQCILLLNDVETMVSLLRTLITSPSTNDHLLAYQVSFDLAQTQQLHFTSKVAQALSGGVAQEEKFLSSVVDNATTQTIKYPTIVDKNNGKTIFDMNPNLVQLATDLRQIQKPAAVTTATTTTTTTTIAEDVVDETVSSVSSPIAAGEDKIPLLSEAPSSDVIVVAEPTTLSSQSYTVLANVVRILHNIASAMIHSHFLSLRCQNDSNAWFTTIFDGLDSLDPALLAQYYVGYSIAQTGTCNDQVIRSTFKNMSGLTEWAAFSAKASVGNVYRGQYEQIRQVLGDDLPKKVSTNRTLGPNELGNYKGGGALFAVGLAASGVTNSHIKWLPQILSNAITIHDEPLQAGASFGLGLSAVGSGTEEYYCILRETMQQEQPIAALAAGISTGLLYLGRHEEASCRDILRELLPLTIDSKHTNAQFGQGLGIALMYLGAQQASEPVTAYLRQELGKTTVFGRWLSCWIDAMAYVGSGNSKTVQRLLHSVVTDTDSDVKRAALLAIAFVMISEPLQGIELLEPLSTSHNTFVRYGVALAVGLMSANASQLHASVYRQVTKKAIAIIQPLLHDRIDVVRQGALISFAFSLHQTTSKERYRECIKEIQRATRGSRSSNLVNRVGGILAAGIIHAGGRNSTISLLSINNHIRPLAVAGMLLFLNYWTFFPLSNFLSLALSPTGVIGTYIAENVIVDGAASSLSSSPQLLPLNKVLLIPKQLRFVLPIAPIGMRYVSRLDASVAQKSKLQTRNKLSASGRANGTNLIDLMTSPKRSDKKSLDLTDLAQKPTLNNSGTENDMNDTADDMIALQRIATKDIELSHSNSALLKQASLKSFASDLIRQNSTTAADTASTASAAATDKLLDPTTTQSDAMDDTNNNANLKPLALVPILAKQASTASVDSLDIPILTNSLSQLSLRRKRQEKIPLTVLDNCQRVLPRFTNIVSCPKHQRYQPIKHRLSGIVVVRRNEEYHPIDGEDDDTTTNQTAQPDHLQQVAIPGTTNTKVRIDDAVSVFEPIIVPQGGDITSDEPPVPAPFRFSESDQEDKDPKDSKDPK